MNRVVIGVFRPAKDGGWEGEIRSLLVNLRARFTPNDDRTGACSPAFHVIAGAVRLGEAWEARWGPQRDRTFYCVSLDDPFLPGPLSLALFPREEGDVAQLVWTRPGSEKRDTNAAAESGEDGPKS